MSLVLRVTRNPKISAMKAYNKSKSVSVRQMVLLVNFLEGHRFLACGNLRKNRKKNPVNLRLWVKCAKILNAEPDGDKRSPKDWKRWFLQYKSRLLTRIRRESQQGTDDDAEATLPLTALEAQFAAVCCADAVPGASNPQEVCSELLEIVHTNGSVGSESKEPSSYDEHESSRGSVSEREESPIPSHGDTLTNNHHPKYSTNRLEVFGRIVALKLQEVKENQREIAEKIIMDTITMGESGCLTMDLAFNFADIHKQNSKI